MIKKFEIKNKESQKEKKNTSGNQLLLSLCKSVLFRALVW